MVDRSKTPWDKIAARYNFQESNIRQEYDFIKFLSFIIKYDYVSY